MAGTAGAGPHLAPGVAGDEVLKIAVEVYGRGHGSVHVFSAENSPPDFHAVVVALAVVHGVSPHISLRRKELAHGLRERVGLFDIREVRGGELNLHSSRRLVREEMSLRGRYD
jgi:hypothetical protein